MVGKEKCKREGHAWTDWELIWDEKRGAIWQRYCLECGEVEKSRETPLEVMIQIKKNVRREASLV